MLSCYVSLCSEFRVLLFSLVFYVLSYYVSLCSEFRVAHFFSFLCFPVTTIYVPLCSEFRFCWPGFLMGSVLLIFLVFGVVLLCIFMFWVPCCNLHYDIRKKVCVVFFVYRCLSFVFFHFIIVFPLPNTASDYYLGVLELFLDKNRNSDSNGGYYLWSPTNQIMQYLTNDKMDIRQLSLPLI